MKKIFTTLFGILTLLSAVFVFYVVCNVDDQSFTTTLIQSIISIVMFVLSFFIYYLLGGTED